MRSFETLTPAEQELLLEAPVIITFLVAGSDNEIDEKEKEWAEKLLEFRSSNNDKFLIEYYHLVDKNWEDQFEAYAARLSDFSDPHLRSHHLSAELAKLNNILLKMNKEEAGKLYKSYLSFADQIAKASGGMFGIGAISAEETRWVNLPMLKDPSQN